MRGLADTGVSTLPVASPGRRGEAPGVTAGTPVCRALALALLAVGDTVLATTPVGTGVPVGLALRAALKLVVRTTSWMTTIYHRLVVATPVLNIYPLYYILYFAPPYDHTVPKVVVEMDVEVAVTTAYSVINDVVVRAVDGIVSSVCSAVDAIVVLTP